MSYMVLRDTDGVCHLSRGGVYAPPAQCGKKWAMSGVGSGAMSGYGIMPEQYYVQLCPKCREIFDRGNRGRVVVRAQAPYGIYVLESRSAYLTVRVSIR